MKKTFIIATIFIIIISIVLYFQFSKSKERVENKKEQTTTKISTADNKIYYCEKTSLVKEGYILTISYELNTKDNEIKNYNLIYKLEFDNQESYKNYDEKDLLSIIPVEVIDDEKTLIKAYKYDIFFGSSDKGTNITIDEYLNVIKKNGFTCET